MTFEIPIAFYVAFGAAAVYFLGLPWLARGALKQPADPDFRRVDEDELSDSIGRYYDDVADAFEELDIEDHGVMCLENHVPNLRAYTRFGVHRATSSIVCSHMIHMNNDGFWQLAQKYSELITEFEDGTLVTTTNQETLGAFPPRPDCIHTIHPEIADLSILFEAHRLIVQQFRSDRLPTLSIYDSCLGDPVRVMKHTTVDDLRRVTKAGYFTCVGDEDDPAFDSADSPYATPQSSESDTPACFVPTVKGMYLMVWKQLWPINSILKNRTVMKSRRMLRKARAELAGF